MRQLGVRRIDDKALTDQSIELVLHIGMSCRERSCLRQLLCDARVFAEKLPHQPGNFLSQQGQAAAPFVASRMETDVIGGQRLLKTGTIECRVSQLIAQLFQAFFYANVSNLPELVRTGKLDFRLLLPVDSQFAVSL